MYPMNPYQTPSFVPPIQFPGSQQQQKTINYVNGRANVESSYLGPNSSDVYIDTGAKKFYTKHIDGNGVATIKEHDYTEAEEPKPPEYVTKAEFELFKASMKGVKHGSNTNNINNNQ